MEIAANIKDSIEALRIVHGRSAVNKYVTVSLGVVTAMIEKEMNPEELIEVCDKLLYDAKEEGRNRIVSDVLRF